MAEKFIKNGKVAVIISPGYGAGFSTWGNNRNEAGFNEDMAFDPVIVQAILDKKPYTEIYKIAKKRYPDTYISEYDLKLTVVWLKQGTKFNIQEYDGSEYLLTDEDFITA